jgi:hypothetical protein
MDPGGTLDTNTPLLANLTQGLKQVTLVDRPKGVTFTSAIVLVVPFDAAA